MTKAQIHELWRIGILDDRELVIAQIDRILSKGPVAEAWTRNGVRLTEIRVEPMTGLDEGLSLVIEARPNRPRPGSPSDRIRNQRYLLQWMMERPDTMNSVLENSLIQILEHLSPGGEFGRGRESTQFDEITGYLVQAPGENS